jgi:hypothetical protein
VITLYIHRKLNPGKSIIGDPSLDARWTRSDDWLEPKTAEKHQMTNMEPDPPTVGQVIGVILAYVFGGSLTLLAVWEAWRNRDLPAFNSYRKSSPSYFRNLVWGCRLNGPLIFCMAFCGVIISPWALADQSNPWLALRVVTALLMFVLSACWLYLAGRWTRWGWRTSLPAKQD